MKRQPTFVCSRQLIDSHAQFSAISSTSLILLSEIIEMTIIKMHVHSDICMMSLNDMELI